MNNRLKLYDDNIHTYISHKDKVKFRKIAFKNKKTVSELNRYLIHLVIQLNDANNLKMKSNELTSFLSKIWRDS